MNNPNTISGSRGSFAPNPGAWKLWLPSLAGLFALILSTTANAQVAVKTITGGPVAVGGTSFGFVDGGALQSAQFNSPEGIALDGGGLIYIADKNNGRIRTVDLTGDRVRTFLSGLSQPVDLVIDSQTNLVVITSGDGALTRYDRFGNRSGIRVSGFVQPMALAMDGLTNYYVSELGGTIKRVTPNGNVSTIASGLNQPSGLAVTPGGGLAVSEFGANTVRLIDLKTTKSVTLSGGNGPGFRDGSPADSQFLGPSKLAIAPNGALVVADNGNNRIRLVDTNGFVSTIYGTNQLAWISDFPGWEDGPVEIAESRAPNGVTVSKDGTSIFVTEGFYHLVRQATGLLLRGNGGNTDGQTGPDGLVVRLQPPTMSPQSGYFPMGQLVTVQSSAPRILYTLDGSEPTTNSFSAATIGESATIQWNSTQSDLRNLKIRAVDGTNTSIVVSGSPSPRNEIGLSRDFAAGPGSIAVVPVVVNLRTNTPLKSLQYRFEITPVKGPAVSGFLSALSTSANDFIPIVNSIDSQGVTRFSTYGYGQGETRGLAVTFIGTNSNFSARDFAVVGMISIPVPSSAAEGDSYEIRIVNPSATMDAQEADLFLEPSASRLLTVRRTGFLVGDSSKSRWYNAESIGTTTEGYGFGDGRLLNSDVNNAFLASFGLKLPFKGTDLFAAMDAYPEDSEKGVGGDGQIRFLDWQVILERSLGTPLPGIGMHTNLWSRYWDASGRLVAASPQQTIEVPRPFTAVNVSAFRSSDVWYRHAAIRASVVEGAVPGKPVEVPVYLNITKGASLAGLQFKASVVPDGDAPPVASRFEFKVDSKLPEPIQVDGLQSDQVGCAWSLIGNSFIPSLSGSVRLGSLKFSIPSYARSGHSYSVKFSSLDGSPLPVENYEFESFGGSVWILTPALRQDSLISDEWKARFFGSPNSPLAGAEADPDGDGVSNALEFAAGTNPLDPNSFLKVQIQTSAIPSGIDEVQIKWLSAPGKAYDVESSSDLSNWKSISQPVVGDGAEVRVLHRPGDANVRYYRVRLTP